MREVAYSPVMGEMLTYLGNKALGFQMTKSKVLYPDENFAREVMQLFSLGLNKLNLDGSEVKDEEGKSVAVYTNEDIMSFARVWTGFTTNRVRSNKVSEPRASLLRRECIRTFVPHFLNRP